MGNESANGLGGASQRRGLLETDRVLPDRRTLPDPDRRALPDPRLRPPSRGASKFDEFLRDAREEEEAVEEELTLGFIEEKQMFGTTSS